MSQIHRNLTHPFCLEFSYKLHRVTVNISSIVIVEYRKFITDESLVYENGRIKIGDRPGLGIELNEDECLKHPYLEHNLRHYTGALTDIRPPKTSFYF